MKEAQQSWENRVGLNLLLSYLYEEINTLSGEVVADKGEEKRGKMLIGKHLDDLLWSQIQTFLVFNFDVLKYLRAQFDDFIYCWKIW